MSARRAAVFFDRDGTLTVEKDWIVRPEELELLPGAAQAVRAASDAGFATVLVTNQSAVARGMIDETQLAAIHARLAEVLARGGARLDAVYTCPHHPTEGVGPLRVDCDCRKPKPGLVLRAAHELDLDLTGSWIVGDAERDVAAGAACGVRGILVATGKGASERARIAHEGRAALDEAPDVLSAVESLLARSRRA